MSKAALKAAALDFANALRAKQGAEPVTALTLGRTHDTGGCSIANTARVDPKVGLCIGPYALVIGPRGGIRHKVETPPDVIDFMAGFDAGEFPELLSEPVIDELAVIA